MDKFIGFDIDHKHTVACVVQAGQPDRYRTLRLGGMSGRSADMFFREGLLDSFGSYIQNPQPS